MGRQASCSVPLAIVLGCAAVATWQLPGEDIRPMCSADRADGSVQLEISNLTPTVTHHILRRPFLDSGSWEFVDSFVAAGSIHVWSTDPPPAAAQGFYRVESFPPADPYEVYFLRNPAVAGLTIDRFDAGTRGFFEGFLDELELTGSVTVDEPVNLQNCEPPQSCTFIYLSGQEFNRILAAKAAHAVWLDRNELVPWRLRDYSDDDLRRLLHEDHLFSGLAPNRFFNRVVDHSPSEAYDYAMNLGLLKSTPLATVQAAMEDFRSDFRHSNTGDPGRDTAYTVLEALTTYADYDRRVSRGGCHAMTRIALGVLRSLNIPGEEMRDGTWFDNGHSTAVWPCIGRVLPHGDNVYNALLLATPAEEFLTPFSFYDAPSGPPPCGTSRPCLSRRHAALNAIAHPSPYTTARCCRPADYGYADCEAFLRGNLGPFLTAEELTTAARELEALCP
ncbi:MAG: hypothetical protein HKN82_15040 [Akkermansiaceae bacterium]|nr:hypothetical protein [Akkermansiaceae bacterium]